MWGETALLCILNMDLMPCGASRSWGQGPRTVQIPLLAGTKGAPLLCLSLDCFHDSLHVKCGP